MKEKKSKYNDFVGIDVGKISFDFAQADESKTYRYANTRQGFLKCWKQHQKILKESLVVVEATGGYEKGLLLFLVDRKVACHQANPRKVKFFIKSLGTMAKTDALDAKALRQYAKERYATLHLYKIQEPFLETLKKLIKRRRELVEIRTAEKNRVQGPDRSFLKKSAHLILRAINQAIDQIEGQIQQLQQEKSIQEKYDKLKEISGVGDKVALTLLASMPELGNLSGKQAASLAGVAPHPYDSGQMCGYRKTRGGRYEIKPLLFLAAMTASKSKSQLGEFYKRLINHGKKPIVAIVALMRKIIVIANAKLRDLSLQKNILTT